MWEGARKLCGVRMDLGKRCKREEAGKSPVLSVGAAAYGPAASGWVREHTENSCLGPGLDTASKPLLLSVSLCNDENSRCQ